MVLKSLATRGLSPLPILNPLARAIKKRRGWDLNPRRILLLNAFRVRRIQPCSATSPVMVSILPLVLQIQQILTLSLKSPFPLA